MLRYLALGDSYTIGEGVDAHERWPAQLARRLRDGGVDVDAPQVIATTGWTTDELAGAIAAEQPIRTADLVTLGIGVNDQYRGRSVADYRAQLQPLLDTAVSLAGGRSERVLMLSIPDWGVTRFARDEGRDAAAIGAQIDAFNATARALCEARRIAFVDITPISRDGAEMVVHDGLHPCAAMYSQWADAALPVARQLLSA